MKVVDASQAAVELSSLLDEVTRGEEVVIERGGIAVARLAPVAQPEGEKPFQRTPGNLRKSPAWKDFKYDPSIFKPLETDEELREEGWEV